MGFNLEEKYNILNEKECLEMIRDIILFSEVFKKIYCIGITGSIGRKEKKIIDSNLNDVDFFVIAEDIIKEKSQLEKKLNQILKTEFSDILYLNIKKYKKIYSMNTLEQSFYDLRLGSIYLYEKTEFREINKKIILKEYNISHRSAFTVYCTRMWCLVGAYDFNEKEGIIIKDEKFANYQVKKAISAIIDATLILNNKYTGIKTFQKIEALKTTKFYFKYQEYYNKILDIYLNKDFKVTEKDYIQILDIYLFFGELILKYKLLFWELIKNKPYIILKKNNFILIRTYMRRYFYLKKIYSLLLKNKFDKRIKIYMTLFLK